VTVQDNRFDDAESEVERGEPWRFREEDAPNPLTIEASGWSSGTTKLGEAEFLNGRDRDGKLWLVLVGGVVLRKRLIDGIDEQWDDEKGGWVVVETLGRVVPGEIVSIKYLGDKEGKQYDYPDFRVVRKPPAGAEKEVGDDIPF
jgi:hypothetical protein